MGNNKEKIGIITLHRNTNYGANLQAYATCKFLSKAAYQSYVIDYLPEEYDKLNHFWSLNYLILKNRGDKSLVHTLKLLMSLFVNAPSRMKRLSRFARFRKKNMNLTSYCPDKKAIERLGFDTVVCGSDQIWNAQITGGIDPSYYGEIAGVSKRIAYAASIGGYVFNEEEKDAFCNLISELDYCSVREEDGVKFVEEFCKKKCECVCDPVFLLDNEEYRAIAAGKLTEKKYLLVYSIISDTDMLEKAKAMARDLNLTLIEICAEKSRSASHRQLVDLGPDEFLSAFMHAELIITNSFHGTAFSIIFRKKFYVFDNPHGGSRLKNLLKQANLSDRLIGKETRSRNLMTEIDYSIVDEAMSDYISKSRQYLLDAVRSKSSFVAESDCVGCYACSKVCPAGSITMKKDAEGFVRAVVCSDTCIDCKLCEKVCPVTRPLTEKKHPIEILAFKSDDKTREKSTSGGAFTAMAEYFLRDGGVVYGASMTEDFSVIHSRVEAVEGLPGLQGVKYVQSDMNACYDDVLRDIKCGKKVLFTGTPCQVSAIAAYAEIRKASRENLFLVDIVCHGVPSPMIFEDYIHWLEKRYKAKLKKYRFRDKSISWRGSSAYAEFDNGTKANPTDANAFMNMYYSHCMTRMSCHSCRYTSMDRISDCTISDFWGIEDTLPEFEDKLGVSMILVNTKQGQEIIGGIDEVKVKVSGDHIKQPQLKAPCEISAEHDFFWEKYSACGISEVLKRYGGLTKPNVALKFARKIKNVFK